MQKEDNVSRQFFLWIVLIVAIASAIILFPFLTSMIAGLLLAFIFYPLYHWLLSRIHYRGLTAFITAVLIIIMVTVPAALFVQSLTKETHYMYLTAKQQIVMGEIIESRCYEQNFICNTINDFNEIMQDREIKEYVTARLNDFLSFVTKQISSVIISLPGLIIQLLVMLFTTYYALKDGKEVLKRIEKAAPLKVHHQEQIIRQFAEVIKALVYGSFIVALIQGTLGAFGLWLFGIENFLWWSVVMTFFALVPFVGTGIVWIPASAYLMLSGYLQSEPTLIWQGIGLFFYGLLIVSSIDNVLKPIIIGGRAKVHPLLILVGILGGLYVFGLIGILLGPITLALLQNLLEIYEKEKQHHQGEPEPDILGHKNHDTKHGK